MTRIISQDNDITGEQRTVRAAQIEQHAVFTGYRDHQHLGNDGRADIGAVDFDLLEQGYGSREWIQPVSSNVATLIRR